MLHFLRAVRLTDTAAADGDVIDVGWFGRRAGIAGDLMAPASEHQGTMVKNK